MTTVPYQPQNLTAEQADGNIALSWSGALNAAGYQIQRSADGVNYSNLATTTTATTYLDVLPGLGTMYYYQVAATNGAGTSVYSTPAQMVAAPPSEMSLYELRLRSQQTADRVNSNFVTTTEWNAFLRLAMYELYDILITVYEDLFLPPPVSIQTNGTTQNYPLPDGVTNYLGGTYPSTAGQPPAQAFYKLMGVDLNVNTSTVTPSRVTLNRFPFIKRNAYVYPNSTSTIYGVYNMRYRVMGNNLNIIPVPSGNQTLIMWYAPRLPALLQDINITTIGYSGWLRYPIVRAAKYALDKEESNTDKLDAELVFLKERINEAAQNRDDSIPDTISDTRIDPIYGGNGFAGGGGTNGGWVLAILGLLPCFMQHDVGNGSLVHAISICKALLATGTVGVGLAYFFDRRPRDLGAWIGFTRTRRLWTACTSRGASSGW